MHVLDETFVRYMYCKYFVPLGSLRFHTFHVPLDEQMFLLLITSKSSVFSCMVSALYVLFKKKKSAYPEIMKIFSIFFKLKKKYLSYRERENSDLLVDFPNGTGTKAGS